MRLLAIALLPLLTLGCSRGSPELSRQGAMECVPLRAPAPEEIRVERDLPYATLGGSSLHLDVYSPTNRSEPLPGLVLLHGGGWRVGSKESLDATARKLALQGYAVVPVQYRLSSPGTNPFPAAVQDARCAVKWLKANGADHGIDPRRIAAAGGSAGGHLASMLGVNAELDSPECAVSSANSSANSSKDAQVLGVISAAGPQDLRPLTVPTLEQLALVTNFLGVLPQENPALAAQASPITYVDASTAPFLLIQGAKDELVPAEQARRMKQALENAGRPVRLVEVENAGHELADFIASGAYPSLECETQAFLRDTLRAIP